jgi:hypothetical protein
VWHGWNDAYPMYHCFCLFRWIFHRREPDDDTFSYSHGSIVGVFVLALLFSAPVEILLVELLIP